jgi:hypothetical protein
MGELRKFILMLLAVIIFVAGIYLGATLLRFVGGGSSAKVYNTPAILQQVQTLSQLVTVKYVIEKVEVLEMPSNNLLGQAIGSKNRVLLLAHGNVKAGIDFSRLKPEDLKISGKKISIELPPVEITDAYLDDQQTKVVDRETGLLAPSDKDLEQTARQNAIEDIQRAARQNGILNDASERAVAQLKNLFQQLGFEEVEIHSR